MLGPSRRLNSSRVAHHQRHPEFVVAAAADREHRAREQTAARLVAVRVYPIGVKDAAALFAAL